MDPVSTATSLLKALSDLYETYECVKENQRACKTLTARLQIFRNPLTAISRGKEFDPKALSQMEDIIEEAKRLISKFSEHTYLRFADAILSCNSWSEKFAQINLKITQAASDLTLSVAVTQEEQRQQDMQDFSLSMQGMMEQVVEHMKAEKSTSAEEMRQIQQEIRNNYRNLLTTMLSCNSYAPLAESEEPVVEQQRDKLVVFCQLQFEQIQASLSTIESGVDDIKCLVKTLLEIQQQAPPPPPPPPPTQSLRSTITAPSSEDEARRLLLENSRAGGDEDACRAIIQAWGHSSSVVNAEDAFRRGNTALVQCAESGKERIVALLLQLEVVQVNKANGSGWNALLWASKNGNIACTKLLLAHPDIHVNHSNSNGYSALHCAAGEGHREVVALLLKKQGIDLSLRNKNRRTAIEVARTPEIKAMFPCPVPGSQSSPVASSPVAAAAAAPPGSAPTKKSSLKRSCNMS